MTKVTNRTTAFAALLALAVAGPATAHDHTEVRIFVIRSQLAQAGANSIVFVGDSIVESALLPAEICGHRVVNAGIGGATTYQYALTARRLAFRAAAVVIAIGTNDAEPASLSEFPDRYNFLDKALRTRSDVVLYAGIPPLESGPATGSLDRASSDKIDDMIRYYAGRKYIDIRSALVQAKTPTLDGVHLSPVAQAVWFRTVLDKLTSALGCG
ncbi:hypothetical protein GWE18_00420 [Bradyrhizobium sp. CSA112]|uniref:SGNH/GDSL hydrolase family protein n=1 Tax=Bradyrhizobium sp. CSA112 TaxID=2699170 RepID=UPI0023B11740|nr:GDSL-type esterase/lipase family protein [Bradyrhizobium sp. CSA112]MDE5451340.1 hypothetical protein [Bradyrhizobium sp. CSA112]